MSTVTRAADSKGRVSLPKTFANSMVIIAKINDSEVRIRKARVIPEDAPSFSEETIQPLTNRDRDRFLTLLSKPPRANRALRRAVRKDRGRRG